MAKTELRRIQIQKGHDIRTCMCDECLKIRARAKVEARDRKPPVTETKPRKSRANLRAVPDPPALLPPTAPLTLEDLPFTSLLWFIIVEPRMPKDRVGKAGLYIATETKEVEQIQTTVGRVVHKGALFGEGRSASGLRMNDDPDFASIQAGDSVLFARYTGQVVKIRMPTGEVRRVILLTDTELMCKVQDPDRIQYWV